jgi:hypothetical protein
VLTGNCSSYNFILLPSGLISRDRIRIKLKFVITALVGLADNISTCTSRLVCTHVLYLLFALRSTDGPLVTVTKFCPWKKPVWVSLRLHLPFSFRPVLGSHGKAFRCYSTREPIHDRWSYTFATEGILAVHAIGQLHAAADLPQDRSSGTYYSCDGVEST